MLPMAGSFSIGKKPGGQQSQSPSQMHRKSRVRGSENSPLSFIGEKTKVKKTKATWWPSESVPEGELKISLLRLPQSQDVGV